MGHFSSYTSPFFHTHASSAKNRISSLYRRRNVVVSLRHGRRDTAVGGGISIGPDGSTHSQMIAFLSLSHRRQQFRFPPDRELEPCSPALRPDSLILYLIINMRLI